MNPVGIPFLMAGFGGQAIQDFATGRVDDRWLLVTVPGALVFLWGLPSPEQLIGFAMLLGYGAALSAPKLLGTGDVLPLALCGLVLGLWAALAIGIFAASMWTYLQAKKRKSSPALPFLAFGFVVSLVGMVLL